MKRHKEGRKKGQKYRIKTRQQEIKEGREKEQMKDKTFRLWNKVNKSLEIQTLFHNLFLPYLSRPGK